MTDSMEIDEIDLDESEDISANERNNSSGHSRTQRRSVLWKYFTVIGNGKAKCDLCSVILSYKTSISNLKIHLVRKHNNVTVPGAEYKLKRGVFKIECRKRPRESNTDQKWNFSPLREAQSSTPPEQKEVKITSPIVENIVKQRKPRDCFLFGCSDFSTMANKSWYIDKTLLIKSTLKECDRLLITAPRRCGKTTNLSTVKKFIEIETNKNGDPLHLQPENRNIPLNEQHSKNFKYFVDKKIFNVTKNGKAIFNKNFFNDHFGQYPVIHINFRNVIGDSFREVLASLKTTLSLTFREHKYLTDSRIWDCGYNKSNFIQLLNSDVYDEMKVADGPRYLSELLYAHFGNKNKVYVLLDDLDAPITYIVQNKQISEDYDFRKILNFLKTLLLRLLKDNPYVERVLAMATHHYAEYLISECNVIHKPFLQNDISRFNGFTNEEVENVFSDMDLTNAISEFKIWYSGYGFSLSNGDLVEIYNNWSVLQYLYEKEFKNYLPLGNLSKFKTVLRRPDFKDKIEVLITRRTITVRYKSCLNFSDIISLKKMLNDSNYSLVEDDADLFFQYLYEAGYLNQLYHTEDTIDLGIPNIEIYSEYCKFFFSFDFFKGYYNVTDEDLKYFAQSLKSLGQKRQVESFTLLANSIKNLFKNAKVLPQNDFELQAPLFHFMKHFFPNIKGEALTMPKRYLKCDIALLIDDKSGVVFEITTYDRGTSLDALSQIVANKYNEILSLDGLTDEVYMGLHLSEDRKITISYIQNNFDLTFADTVQSL